MCNGESVELIIDGGFACDLLHWDAVYPDGWDAAPGSCGKARHGNGPSSLACDHTARIILGSGVFKAKSKLLPSTIKPAIVVPCPERFLVAK